MLFSTSNYRWDIVSFDDPLENPGQDPELKDGSRVRINSDPIQYTWQNGKVVDKDGREVDVEEQDCLPR